MEPRHTTHPFSSSHLSSAKVTVARIVSDVENPAVRDDLLEDLDRYTSLLKDLTASQIAEVLDYADYQRSNAFRRACDRTEFALIKAGMTSDQANELVDSVWEELKNA